MERYLRIFFPLSVDSPFILKIIFESVIGDCFCCLNYTSLNTRGGVEDTRLEAKAKVKDTKKSEAKAKDSLSEDRHSRGKDRNARGQGPRTQAQVLSKKKRSSQKFFRRSPQKKRSLQKFFKRSPQKNVFQKIFQALHKILTIQKIVLSSSRGQANF